MLDCVLRSVLESADQALRQKPRHPSVVSSVVRSPPPRSSVQKIESETGQSVATGDVRTVVHGKSKDVSRQEKHRHRQEQRSTMADRTSGRTSEEFPTKQLLITVTDETVGHGDDQKPRSAYDERKVSVLDEDQFEPDYDEGEMTMEVEHRPHKESTSADGKHSRHKRSRHHHHHKSDSSTKSKKHRKHRKRSSRKHKSKSKKTE